MCSIYSDISEEEDLFFKKVITSEDEQKKGLSIPTAAIYHEPEYNYRNNFRNNNHNNELQDFQDKSNRNILFVKSYRIV